MAYMSQEKKKALTPKVKEILKKYGMKGRLGVHHHSTLVLNITEGPIDFFNEANNYGWGEGYLQVNEYHYKTQYTGRALDFLSEIIPALNEGNFDNSDPQTDYFHVGWYVDINIGKWNKPYRLTV